MANQPLPQNDSTSTTSTDQPSENQSGSHHSKKNNKDSKFDSNNQDNKRKRYKILAGNGCHQAIAEVQGILIPPTEENGSFNLVLPDGLQIEATFKTPRLHWIAQNKDYILGPHWFRGYPKMKDDKLVNLQIIAWDGNMPSNKRGEETWEFVGVWTAQKNITVQRSMMTKDIRKIARETGFIKKFKYTFINSYDWVKSRKLWVGYVYKVQCKREGDTFVIRRVTPYACPRIKPVPKSRGNRRDRPQGQSRPYNKKPGIKISPKK